MTPFESLVKEFPIFVVKNKTAITKNIPIKDNEELVVPSHAIVKIDANLLGGIPSSTFFKMVSPSVKDLIKHGLISSKKEDIPAPVVANEKAVDKSWDDKKKKK